VYLTSFKIDEPVAVHVPHKQLDVTLFLRNAIAFHVNRLHLCNSMSMKQQANTGISKRVAISILTNKLFTKSVLLKKLSGSLETMLDTSIFQFACIQSGFRNFLDEQICNWLWVIFMKHQNALFKQQNNIFWEHLKQPFTSWDSLKAITYPWALETATPEVCWWNKITFTLNCGCNYRRPPLPSRIVYDL